MTAKDLTKSWSTAMVHQSNIQLDGELEKAIAEALEQESEKMMKMECTDWDCMDEYDSNTVCTVDRLGSDMMTEVDVPKWVPKEDGYKATSAQRIGKRGSTAYVVTYAPTKTMGVGFSKVFIVDSKTKKPFPKMKEMWEEMYKRFEANAKNSKKSNKGTLVPFANPSGYGYVGSSGYSDGYCLPANVTISKTGELRGAFGCPKPIETYGVAVELNTIYRDWKNFPKETDYEMVKKLKTARAKVFEMQNGAEDYEGEIANSRNTIKEYQKHIADLEAKMNKLYEEAADAMNLLEEHGVKVDLSEKGKAREWTLDDDDLFKSFDLTVPYDGSDCCISGSLGNDGTYYTTIQHKVV